MNDDPGKLGKWLEVLSTIGDRISASKNPVEESLAALSELDSWRLDADERNLVAGLLLRTAARDAEAIEALNAAAGGSQFYVAHIAKSVLSNYDRKGEH